MFDNTSSSGPKFFFSYKTAFFEKFCFQKPLRFYKNDLITCTMLPILFIEAGEQFTSVCCTR